MSVTHSDEHLIEDPSGQPERRHSRRSSRGESVRQLVWSTPTKLARRFASVEPASWGSNRWLGWMPLIIVAGAVIYGLIAFAPERLPVAYPNDASVHILSVTTAEQQIRAGHLPFGSWFPDLATGSPFFLHYQSTPAVLTGLISLLFGVQTTFGWSLYLLFATIPLSIYWSGRIFGLGRFTSAMASAASLFLVSYGGYGLEQQSYDWLGSGMWTQLWGIWVLPLAWAAIYRAVSKREFRGLAIFFLACTIAFHFLTAYLAALSLVVIVLLRPRDLLVRCWRGGLVAIGAAGLTLFVTIPLAVYGKWGANNEFQINTFWNDSYGARRVLGWLVTGRIYDNGRFPVVTIFVALGIVVCLLRWRRDELSRAVLSLWVLSLLLFFGRPTLRPVIDLLPGNSTLLLHRYVMGVHAAGLFLAAMGAYGITQVVVALARRAARRTRLSGAMTGTVRWWQLGLGAIAVVGILAPAWSQLVARDRNNSTAITAQQGSDLIQGTEVNALIAKTRQLGGGRVFGGLLGDPWEFNYRVGQVEMCIYLADEGVDAVGFSLRTSALMANPEGYFDEYNLGDYDAFGIRFLILPSGMKAPVPATFVEQQGTYVLWSVATHGYVQVVDTTSPITANANDLGATTRKFLDSSQPGQGIYPTIAFSGAPAATPTLSPGEIPKGPPGTVLSSDNNLADGSFSATVNANRTSVVLLKASYDPGWSVTVDGVATSTEMVAPALVGVEVAPGTHDVVFTYHGYAHYNLLFAIDIVVLLLVIFGSLLKGLFRRLLPKHLAPSP